MNNFEGYAQILTSLPTSAVYLIRLAVRSLHPLPDRPVLDTRVGALEVTWKTRDDRIGALELQVASKNAGIVAKVGTIDSSERPL